MFKDEALDEIDEPGSIAGITRLCSACRWSRRPIIRCSQMRTFWLASTCWRRYREMEKNVNHAALRAYREYSGFDAKLSTIEARRTGAKYSPNVTGIRICFLSCLYATLLIVFLVLVPCFLLSFFSFLVDLLF